MHAWKKFIIAKKMSKINIYGTRQSRVVWMQCKGKYWYQFLWYDKGTHRQCVVKKAMGVRKGKEKRKKSNEKH